MHFDCSRQTSIYIQQRSAFKSAVAYHQRVCTYSRNRPYIHTRCTYVYTNINILPAKFFAIEMGAPEIIRVPDEVKTIPFTHFSVAAAYAAPRCSAEQCLVIHTMSSIHVPRIANTLEVNPGWRWKPHTQANKTYNKSTLAQPPPMCESSPVRKPKQRHSMQVICVLRRHPVGRVR